MTAPPGYQHEILDAAREQAELFAVERWARARGILWPENAASRSSGTPPVLPWAVRVSATGALWLQHWNMDAPQSFDPHTALVWALAVESGATVDMGRCRVCPSLHSGKHRRDVVSDLLDHPGEWRCFVSKPALQRAANAMAREGLLERLVDHANRFRFACCSGTGRFTRDAARLVLDAAPIRSEDTEDFEGRIPLARHRRPDGSLTPSRWSGKRDATDALRVLADRLQAEGDPLGTTLALWLAGKREGTAADAARLRGLRGLDSPLGMRITAVFDLT